MFDRRRKIGVAGIAALAATAMLAAGCGASSSSTSKATAVHQGGTVTLANIDGAGAEHDLPAQLGSVLQRDEL